MTLTICIAADDGIVLASDSRATSRDPRLETTINDTMKKIFPLGNHGGVGIAGDGGIAMRLIDTLEEKINTKSEIRKLVENFYVFTKSAFSEWFPYNEPRDVRKSSLAFIVSGFTKSGKAEIYELDSFDNFVPRKSPVGFSCIGVSYLAQYLLNTFYQPEITIKHAAELAAFCIKETASQDGKVGGNLQLASFSSKSDFHQFTPFELGKVEKRCEELRLEFREKVYKTETRGEATVSRKEEKKTKVITSKRPATHAENK